MILFKNCKYIFYQPPIFVKKLPGSGNDNGAVLAKKMLRLHAGTVFYK
jgi:hypothetical protein